MRCVFAQVTAALPEVVLRAGDPWHPNDPVVRRRPDLFGPEPPAEAIRHTVDPEELEPVDDGRARRGVLGRKG